MILRHARKLTAAVAAALVGGGLGAAATSSSSTAWPYATLVLAAIVAALAQQTLP